MLYLTFDLSRYINTLTGLEKYDYHTSDLNEKSKITITQIQID